MATDAGQHVLGTMVAGSSGHRRTRMHREKAAGACPGLLNGMRGAGGFYSLVGGGEAARRRPIGERY